MSEQPGLSRIQTNQEIIDYLRQENAELRVALKNQREAQQTYAVRFNRQVAESLRHWGFNDAADDVLKMQHGTEQYVGGLISRLAMQTKGPTP